MTKNLHNCHKSYYLCNAIASRTAMVAHPKENKILKFAYKGINRFSTFYPLLRSAKAVVAFLP